MSRGARITLRALAVAASLGVLGPLPGSAVASSKPRQRFFETVGGAVECELDDGGAAGIGVDAYCETLKPPRSATLSASGKLARCYGPTCVSNPPLNVRTLAAGRTVRLGPFTCRAEAATISCTIKSGAGFSISHAGVKSL